MIEFNDIPKEFIDAHISPMQKDLLKIKYEIYLYVNENKRTPMGLMIDYVENKYFIGRLRASELIREAKLGKRLKQKDTLNLSKEGTTPKETSKQS